MSNQEQNLEEVKKSSAGVNAEIPDPTGVSAKKLPGSKEQGDKAPQKLKEEEAVESQETQEEVVEQPTLKISREDISVKEDIAAAFKGTELSEEFITKATEIFEVAVVSKVNEKLAEMSEKVEQDKVAELKAVQEQMTSKIDQYLDYVVEQYMEENKLAIEQGLRAEIVENFLTGLRDLFAEHYIDVPEEKVDVVEEMAAKIEELEASVNEQIAKNVEMKQKVESVEREVAFVEVSEGLTETQIAKFESLSENVEFDTAEGYKQKLQTIRENYFSDKSTEQVELSESKELDSEPVEQSEAEVTGPMRAYADAISRTIKK